MINDFLSELDRQTNLYREMLGTKEPSRMQELMLEISRIDTRIAAVRRRWPEVASTLDTDTARRAGASIDAARDVLSRLVDRFVPPPPARRIGEAYGD